jgi:hypothetical protein
VSTLSPANALSQLPKVRLEVSIIAPRSQRRARCGPETREQACWCHKLANVLDKLPVRFCTGG